MNAFNRFIITALLVLFTSQAFATNTLLATTTTENATAITETKAFANPFKYGNHNSFVVNIKSTENGTSGNGSKITINRRVSDYQNRCSVISGGDTKEVVMACSGENANTTYIREFINSNLSKFNATGGGGGTFSNFSDPEIIILAGGLNTASAIAQVVEFIPTSANVANTVYTIKIDENTYTHTTTGADSVATIISALQTKVTADAAVSCTNETTKIICTANTAGTAFTYSSNAVIPPLTFTSNNTQTVEEGTQGRIHTFTTNHPIATFNIIENTSALFSLNNSVLNFNGINTDYESDTKSYTVKVKATIGDGEKKNAEQIFTVNLLNINDETPTNITLSMSGSTDNHTITENTTNTNLGTLSTTDADVEDAFIYTLKNNSAAYFTIDGNTLQLAKTVDYETTKTLSITIRVADANGHTFSKDFNFTIIDIDDTAPTDIALTNNSIAPNATADTIIGTLSATDIDTTNDGLTYSINDTNFKITGTQLQLKINATEITDTFPITLAITATNNINTALAFTKNFMINSIDIRIIPVIKQFTVTQGNNQGRIISKTGGVVTVHATVAAKTHEWSSTNVTDTSANSDTVFVFDPANTDTGILTITLKATTDTHSSERVLRLELVDNHPSDWIDVNSNGISDSKESEHGNNELLAGMSKKITSPTDTRILLGAMGKMGEDSSRLTLAQMKEYIASNNSLTDKTDDTLTTGDIYDYVIEGLSAAGTTTEVIIELTTIIPENAKLRKYSLVNGWSNFKVDTDNTIHSKISTTCTDDSAWKAGLTTGATCLKLTIKDGGENDTDGEQADNTGDANGVIASTVSIAVSTSSSDSSNSSGGGCVYNPNAPARFDMGFILLMVLSAYYLIRRKRRFVH